MSESSWQRGVLAELGVAGRGLTTLHTVSSQIPGADWGADSAPRAVDPEPIVSAPHAIPQPPPVPTPPPAFAPAASVEPAPSAAVAGMAAPAPESVPQPVPEAPAASAGGDAPSPQAVPSPAAPVPPHPGVSHDEPAQPQMPQPWSAQPAQPAPEQPEQPEQPAASGGGGLLPGFSEEQLASFSSQRDPFGDSPPPAEAPPAEARPVEHPAEPVAEPVAPAAPDVPAAEPPQPVAAAPTPLFNPDFDPEMAVAPSVGGAPPMSGAPPGSGSSEPPQIGTLREDSNRPEAEPEPSASPAAASAQPSGPAPQQAPQPQQAGQGAVPMADELVRKSQHGDPLMRRMGRGMRKAVGATGSSSAVNQAEIVALLQRQVPSTRQIAVASVRGGAGKTSISALVASELARHRQDRVIAMDADAELGSLPLRLGVRTEMSLFDLAAQQPRTFEEAERFLARTETGLWVLPSTRGGRIAGEFTIETFQSALASIARYFAAAVVDCGAGILTELHRGILGQTHGLVLVTPATADGALSARGALEWFGSSGRESLMSRTVIAMVTHAPQVGADLERAREMLSAWGLPIVLVPYDRHLAAGGSLDTSKIGEATRTAAALIASEVFARSLGGTGVAR